MIKSVSTSLLAFIAASMLGSALWALDEGVLTPTVGTSVSQDEQEFQDAMAVKEFARVW